MVFLPLRRLRLSQPAARDSEPGRAQRRRPPAASSLSAKPEPPRLGTRGGPAASSPLASSQYKTLRSFESISLLTILQLPTEAPACSARWNPRPRHLLTKRTRPSPESRRKRPSCAASSSLYSLSAERDRGRPALAQLLDAREGGGVAFPEGDARGGSFLWGTRSGRGARAARPQLARPPARRVPARSSARARWRPAPGPYRVWLYVAREWRQNSNGHAWWEARLLPAASQVHPGRTRRLGRSVGWRCAGQGGLSL